MSDSDEVESEDEFDLQLEFLDLFDPKRARKIHPIACANCTLSLEYVKYIECQECRATICFPCFQLGCEMGDHERDHAYRIVNGLQNKKLKGHWNDKNMTELILAAQKHKLGNWNEYLENPRHSHHSRASVCSFFDQFMIRGIIGQFALTEGFWMKDRHKYKRQGTLQKLLDEETHSNPLLYSMYLAAMRWKKGIHWKPNDPKLEEKIRVVCKDYINYKFDIEGRELLGSLHDDYFFGGDLNLPKPIVLNPEFEEAEVAQSQILRNTEREAVGFYEKEQERKKRQIQIIKQQTHNGEVIALDMTAFLPKIIIQREGDSGHGKDENERSPDEPGPSRVTPKRSNRSNCPVLDESPLQQLPESSSSLAQHSPLKIVLKKGEKGNYIVALNTLNSEIDKEGTMANMIKAELQKKAQELGSLSRLRVEGIPDQGTSSETNGYHSPEQNGINGTSGTESDIEENELFTDDNSNVDTDECRLEHDTQLDETDIDQLAAAAQQLLEDSDRATRRGRPKKKVTYVEEEEEEPIPASSRARTRRKPKKHGDEEDEQRSGRVQLRARRTIKPVVQDDEEDYEPPVEVRRRSRKKNTHIDEDEEDAQADEPRTRRSSRLYIKIPDAEEQEEQVEEEEPEEEAQEERSRTLKNVISQKKQRRKKKVNVQKSKKMRRIEAFQKRESKKAKKKEKANLKYTDIISLDQIRALREKCSRLQLYCDEERRRRPPKFRPDDIAMLTFNPHRNEYECESINDAEKLVGNLQIGPLTALHEMTDLEHEVKFARIERYNRALHIRNARKNAINEHDKIFEFIDYIKFMVSDTNNTDAMYDNRTPLEKIFQRTQQTLTRDEYNLLVQRWKKFTDMKYKIQKLQDLQRQGVTSLKGVELKSKDNRIKRNLEIPKKADSRYRTFQKNHLRMYHMAEE